VAIGIMLLGILPGCLQDGRGPGALAGPSSLALSIRLSATPDVLPADGRSEATIAVTATGPDGAPADRLRLRARILDGSTPRDLGRLSERSIVTDAAGRAAFSYRAPPPAGNAAGEVDAGRVVTLVVTPVTEDFTEAIERRVRVRLVPAGAVIPPFDVRPGFEVTPAAPGVFDQVRFSAPDCPAGAPATAGCTHDPSGLVAVHRWDFGDGEQASGQQIAHVYSRPGTYLVRLTVTDAFERSADATRTVVVAAGVPPSAAIAVSPIPGELGTEVFFDASMSMPAAGRRIVSHAWNFGDGSTGSGVTASHVYRSANTYTVVLNVTDDAGSVGSASARVDIVDGTPVAVVTFSPPSPVAGQSVLFSAENSGAVGGRRIVRYRWDFGDGSEGAEGLTASHVYATAGEFEVRLAVTDSGNRTGWVTVPVSVE
jgi:PKD repeat protein